MLMRLEGLFLAAQPWKASEILGWAFVDNMLPALPRACQRHGSRPSAAV